MKIDNTVNEYIRKLLDNFKFDKDYIVYHHAGLLPKIAYIFNKYYSIALGKRSIKFLGNDFTYDNKFTPALLETYPREIVKINRVINLSDVRTVLDIGANVGQWAYTLKHFFQHVCIYSFEPNKDIFSLLERNAQTFTNWDVYNFALGNSTGKRVLFYSPGASAEGTFFRENLNQMYYRPVVTTTTVDVVKLDRSVLKELQIPDKIDLVKIDVEGAEAEVVQSLKDIDFTYLYIEVSMKRKGGSLQDIRTLIESEWDKKAEVIYYDMPDKKSPFANAIFFLSDI